MANSYSVRILQDGPLNTRVKIEGILDTSDLAYTVAVLPQNLTPIDALGNTAGHLRVNRLDYTVEPGSSLILYWDNTTPANADRLIEMTSSTFLEAHKYGDFNNPRSAGATGGIAFATRTNNGPPTTALPTQFTVILSLIKQL